MAGPVVGDDGGSVIGNFLENEAENQADAELFGANEPYAKACLFDSVLIKAWKNSAG